MDILQPTHPADQRGALALLMSRDDSTSQQVDSQIDTLTAYAASYGLSLQNVLVACEAGRALGACLCVDSPGRVSSVFLPAQLTESRSQRAASLLLGACAERARARDVQLLQVMLDADTTIEARLLQEARFEKVARLLYLERDLAEPLGTLGLPAGLRWQTYTDEARPLFAKALQESYQSSLDCPSLNGRRDIDDVLASHRAAGRFDPRGWVIALDRDRAIGLVLVNEFPERLASEVVYMGILPVFRGRGYGSAVLRHAVAIAREQCSLTLALSVDETNIPARRLYERYGFRETARRDAWIRFLG